MNALLETTPATQATEKLFIADLPVTYKSLDQDPVEATYNYPYTMGNRHAITLTDGKNIVATGDEITPSRSLTDEEMIAYLNEQLYLANEEAQTYKKWNVDLRSDLNDITEALRQEAENRGWCSEYNDFCDAVNSKLILGDSLIPIEEEYEVEVEVTATVSTRVRLSVMARSQDLAEEMVIDDPDAFFDPSEQALEEASNGGFDNCDVEVC
jgi:hypothetical protein